MAQGFAQAAKNLGGYRFGETVYYTASGSFAKGDYPGMRAVIVKCQGGGGAGGGAATTGSGQVSGGQGGGGGGYAESLVLVSDLDTSEAITVGAGGTGVSGAAGNDGADSIFDTISGEVRGVGGEGGDQGNADAPTVLIMGNGTGGGGTGDLVIPGSDGHPGFYLHTTAARAGGHGGASHLAGARKLGNVNSDNGATGQSYGGGGSGASNAQNQVSARTGGAGAPGIVIVEVYY